MKLVLIVEDKYAEVRVPFEYVNDMLLDNELVYKVVPRSQDVPYADIDKFDFIFIDIQLAKKSDMEGYVILKRLEADFPNKKNIIVLTGNSKVRDTLRQHGLVKDYRVLIKPIDYKELLDIFTNPQ